MPDLPLVVKSGQRAPQCGVLRMRGLDAADPASQIAADGSVERRGKVRRPPQHFPSAVDAPGRRAAERRIAGKGKQRRREFEIQVGEP